MGLRFINFKFVNMHFMKSLKSLEYVNIIIKRY